MMAAGETGSGGEGSGLSLKLMLSFATANIGLFAIDNIFDQYLGMLYIDHRYITYPLLLGVACFVGRAVDAAANPVVGYWSDRSFGPRGRRIPFIMRGAAPATLFFILLFIPFTKSNYANFAQTMLCSSGMLFFFTYMCAPYTALIPDLTSEGDERVKLTTYWSLAGIVGIVVAVVLAGGIIDVSISKFRAAGMANDEPYAYSIMALLVGLLSLATFYFTAFTVKEKPFPMEERVTLSFMDSFLPSLKNRLFIIYAISISSFWIGFKVLQTTVNFVCKYVFGKSEAYGSEVGLGGLIVVFLAATPLVFFLQKKYGKKPLFAGALLFIALVSFAQGLIDVVPKGAGLYLYLGLLFSFGAPFAVLQVLYPVIIGEIVEQDAAALGVRREAMYFGVEGMVSKLARGIGWPVVMALFQIFGRPSAVNHKAMIVAGPVCGVFALVGFFAFLKYPSGG